MPTLERDPLAPRRPLSLAHPMGEGWGEGNGVGKGEGQGEGMPSGLSSSAVLKN
jgi:hypothetical protein